MTDGIPATLVDTSHLTIKKGSKSFAAAARFFSIQMREDAYMLYAWCRHCDDVIDNQGVLSLDLADQVHQLSNTIFIAPLVDNCQ